MASIYPVMAKFTIKEITGMILNSQKRQLILSFLSLLPRSLRQHKKLYYLSLFSFTLPMLLAFVYVCIDSEAINIIMNDFQVKQMEQSFDPLIARLRPKQTFYDDITMLNFYIVNNITICFAILFSGLFFGIGTCLLLVFQGVSMGLRVGYVYQLGYNETLWPFLIGHTSFEIIAVIIAGGCGYKLGLSLLIPGELTRLNSILNTMQDIAYVMIIVMVFFLLAAFIETFWSSNMHIHVGAKYFFGACGWAALIYYLVFFGKESRLSNTR